MKIAKLFFLVLVLACFNCCTTPRVYVDDNLKSNATEYAVEGRQNPFNHTVRFGAFELTHVKRGWTTSSSSRGIFKTKEEAKNKMSFKIKYKLLEGETFTASQAVQKGFDFGKIQMSDNSKDVFTGMIQMKDKTPWDFFVKNPNNLNWDDPSTGYATDGDKRIEIRDIRKAAGKTPKLMVSTIFGYSLLYDKTPIAVVETIAGGKGSVWMKKGLDPDVEFVAANLAAALLLRPDLSSSMRQY